MIDYLLALFDIIALDIKFLIFLSFSTLHSLISIVAIGVITASIVRGVTLPCAIITALLFLLVSHLFIAVLVVLLWLLVLALALRVCLDVSLVLLLVEFFLVTCLQMTYIYYLYYVVQRYRSQKTFVMREGYFLDVENFSVVLVSRV